MGRRDLAEVRRLIDRGDGELSTVADLVDRFLRDVVAQEGRRPGQVASEKPRLRRIRESLGHLTVEMLCAQDVARWRDQRLKEGAAPQTVHHDLNQLSVLLGTAIGEWGLAAVRNVVRDIRRPSLPAGRERRVSQAEIEALLTAADQAPRGHGRYPSGRGMREIITLAVETSMRLGELIALEWKYIDLESCVARLPATKNGDARSVALSPAAVLALKSLGYVRRLDGRVFDWARSDSFVGRFSRLVAQARAKYEVDAKAKGANPDAEFLTDLRFHDLRHEATSRLFEHGLNPMEVASMTGHRSMQMLRRYTHVDAKKVAAKLA